MPMTKRPAFRVGDHVRFDFSIYKVQGVITEYRGRLAKGGGHMYGITFTFDDGESKVIELPEDEFELDPAASETARS